MIDRMETKETVQEVSKSQLVRLIDVLILGPMMMKIAYSYEMPDGYKLMLGIFGAATIYYNARNYMINRSRLQYA